MLTYAPVSAQITFCFCGGFLERVLLPFRVGLDEKWFEPKLFRRERMNRYEHLLGPWFRFLQNGQRI